MSTISVHVVSVSAEGEAVVEQVAEAGHTVSGPQPVGLAELPAAIAGAPGADLVLVVGAADATSGVPLAVEEACTRVLAGIGELGRRLAFELEMPDAAYLQPTGGITSRGAVFLIPDRPALAERLVASLLPGFPQFGEAAAPVASSPAEPAAAAASASSTTEEPQLPAGVAHRATEVGLAAALDGAGEAPAAPVEEEVPNRGWKRAVHDLKAEVHLDRREDLPEPIEKLAPVVNVLHTAGEVGMMKLPSGRRYGLYGWPDLRRSNAKVLAISWGEPLAEVVALHRYPNRAGTLVPGKLGILPSQDRHVDAISEEVVGKPPLKPDGKPFAIDEKEVWLLRERRVVKWDGRRERDDGSPKQVLASLALSWSNR